MDSHLSDFLLNRKGKKVNLTFKSGNEGASGKIIEATSDLLILEVDEHGKPTEVGIPIDAIETASVRKEDTSDHD